MRKYIVHRTHHLLTEQVRKLDRKWMRCQALTSFVIMWVLLFPTSPQKEKNCSDKYSWILAPIVIIAIVLQNRARPSQPQGS